MAGQDHCRSISQLRLEHLSAKTKKKEGSARAWPVAAPMPKSDYFSRERCRMMGLGTQFFAYLLPWGWLSFYNVSCSQFEGCRDSLSLDKIFPAFIE